MDFHKDLSYIGWEEVRNRQLLRFPLVEEWIRLTGMIQGNTVVDIGSGTGIFVCEYSKIVSENGKVFAIEKSKDAINYLENGLSKTKYRNVDIINADSEENINIFNEIDIVMITDVLHHSNNPEKIIINTYNLINDSSLILIAEFNPDSECSYGPPKSNRIPIEKMNQMLGNQFSIKHEGTQGLEHYYLLLTKK